MGTPGEASAHAVDGSVTWHNLWEWQPDDTYLIHVWSIHALGPSPELLVLSFLVTQEQVSKAAVHGGTQVVYMREGLLTWHQHTKCPRPFKEWGWCKAADQTHVHSADVQTSDPHEQHDAIIVKMVTPVSVCVCVSVCDCISVCGCVCVWVWMCVGKQLLPLACGTTEFAFSTCYILVLHGFCAIRMSHFL